MNHVPQPQGEKLEYYFQSVTCPGALETHVFLSFLWSVVRKRPVINDPPNNIKNTKKKDKTNRILSNSIKEINLALHISARHIYQLQTSVICTSALQSYLCYIFYENADNNLKRLHIRIIHVPQP